MASSRRSSSTRRSSTACSCRPPTGGVIADIDPLNVDAIGGHAGAGERRERDRRLCQPGDAWRLDGRARRARLHAGQQGRRYGDQPRHQPGRAGGEQRRLSGRAGQHQEHRYTLALTDAGKTIYSTSASADTWTIPLNSSVAFPIGTIIALVNTGTANVTIARGGRGDAEPCRDGRRPATRTLAQWGVATMIQVAANQWVISGTGVS